MRGHAAARGEDAFGGDHAAQIFGRRLDADEQHLLALLGRRHGAVGVEIDLAGGGARARRAGRWRSTLAFFDLGDVEDRREELLELIGRDCA